MPPIRWRLERLQEALDAAIEKRDLSYVTDSQIATAESDVVDKEIAAEIAADKVTDIDDAIAEITEQISNLGGGTAAGDASAEMKALQTAQDALNTANSALQTANLIYGEAYDVLDQLSQVDFPGADKQVRMAAYAEIHPVVNALKVNGVWTLDANGDPYAWEKLIRVSLKPRPLSLLQHMIFRTRRRRTIINLQSLALLRWNPRSLPT